MSHPLQLINAILIFCIICDAFSGILSLLIEPFVYLFFDFGSSVLHIKRVKL